MRALGPGTVEVLVSRSCKIGSSSGRSFYDNPARFSYTGPGMKILVYDLLQVLAKFLAYDSDMLSGAEAYDLAPLARSCEKLF